MAHNSTIEYLKLLNELQAYNISKNIVDSLSGYLKFIYRSELENQFSAPMLWIGMYIALASLVCIVAMVADLLHGFRSKKLWFPCEYFRINSASLTVISVAMKLPVDLTGSMAGTVDQVAKLGSMAFMCTMMANLLPCLTTMDDNDLLSNMAALCLLVITVVVNVCIQIQTGVVSVQTYSKDPRITALVSPSRNVKSLPASIDNYTVLHVIYVTLLLALLVLYLCSSLAIRKSRSTVELKYQEGHEAALKEIQHSPGRLLTVEKLMIYVQKHWIMAGSFKYSQLTFISCFHTTSASGMICVFVTILHILTMSWTIESILAKDYDSDYSWSMIVIVVSQFIGVVIGTIVPLARCFALVTSFHRIVGTVKIAVKKKTSFHDVGSIYDTYIKAVISNHINIFKVESYWTHKLYAWKRAIIRVPFHIYSLRMVIQILKELILSFCIGFQKGVVVVCKILALIPFLFMMCMLYCLCQFKQLLKGVLISSSEEINTNCFENEINTNCFEYLSQLEGDMMLAMTTYEELTKSVNELIQKSKKNQSRNFISQSCNLIKLIQEKSSVDFRGVGTFNWKDHHHVPSLLSNIERAWKVTYRDCWRLSVVTLTTIAIPLASICMNEVESLLRSVREGLVYVELVEESLNVTYDYLFLQKVAETLWNEVHIDHKWLGHELQVDPSLILERTCGEIVEWFRDAAKKIILNAEARPGYEYDYSFFAAYSMYSITETIMLTTYPSNLDAKMITLKELFDYLSSIISDIIAACLTNLPQVITMKCHTSYIEKREAGVKDAAQLLGMTSRIIEILQDRDIPNINPNDMPFIVKWCDFFRESLIP